MNQDVLVCSAGRRVALVRILQEALAELGSGGRVLACDVTDKCAAAHVADGFFSVPGALHEDFLPSVLDLCRREGVSLVVPTTDTTLPFYADARERFADAGTTIAVSSPATVALSADKRKTWQFFRTSGISTVRQAEVAAVRRSPGKWRGPVVVKPTRGSSSVGVDIVSTPLAFEAAVTGRDVVVQEVAPGVEYTIDMFIDRNGRLVDAVPRQRLEVRAGEVSKAVTVRATSLLDLAIQVAAALPGAYGVLNLQVFWDGIDAPRAIEINPRFGGGFPLSHAAGAPFARWLLESAQDLPLTPAPMPWEDGLMMLRFDDAVLLRTGKAAVL